MKIKYLVIAVLVLFVACGGAAFAGYLSIASTLPQIMTMKDYKPLLVSEVYARGGEKIGEFYRENRTLVAYDKIPRKLIDAFLAAEDDTFFQHGGINYAAMLRAFLINLKSGKKTQGASTITQQVARSLLLSSEKTYTRKIKEILLAYKIEANLRKEDILYLYLNQIYFGQSAYGIAAAADTYFRKTVDQLSLAEMAILAGLPKAPSDYSPATNPQRAKERQRYVLQRMADVGFVKIEEAKKASAQPIKVYTAKEYKSVGPYYLETVRQMLVEELGETAVLDEGLRVYTSLDFKAQQKAQDDVQAGLRAVDKREGFRGALKNIHGAKEVDQFLLATRRSLESKQASFRIMLPEGNVQPERPLMIYHKNDISGHIITNVPDYVSIGQIVEGIVGQVDDARGMVFVRFGESQGIIAISDMDWARKPDPAINALYAPKLQRPSLALKAGDVIEVKVLAAKFDSAPPPAPKKKGAVVTQAPGSHYDDYAKLALEQMPQAEGALISFDQKSGEVIAMVGGYEFKKNVNEFNRAILAKRQTGSAFKSIVYASALDKGFTPATPIIDAPIVYDVKNENEDADPEDQKTWKPHNHGQRFGGDILVRSALARSLNIPAVKILESVGVSWVIEYAKRLGIFSPLNADLSLALGSSSLTLFEMTRAFSEIGRQGVRLRPVMIHRVMDKEGKDIATNLTLDQRFRKELGPIDKDFEEKRKAALQTGSQASRAQNKAPAAVPNTAPNTVPNAAASTPDPAKKKTPNLFFEDPEQLISPQTAYVMTTLLEAVINDPGGTAGAARAIGRPAAGKTGSTNGYFDGWFVGFTPQVATGVWVGFDSEKTLGPGEVGGRTALPIWLEYMKTVHKDLPVASFPVPQGIVFANIDAQTGKLASAASTTVINQAFIQGTEPKELSGSPQKDDPDFYKEDLNE